MTKDKFYEGKLLFETFCGWGAAASNNKLIEFARQRYGRASQMGPSYSMWKWAFRNPEEAYEFWKNYYFEAFPEEQQPTFNDFVVMLKQKGRNPSIGGDTALQRFCAKYGLEFDYKIEKGYVIQVTRPNHVMYQKLLVVDDIVEQNGDSYITAYALEQDGSRSNHQLKMREFGIIGKAII